MFTLESLLGATFFSMRISLLNCISPCFLAQKVLFISSRNRLLVLQFAGVVILILSSLSLCSPLTFFILMLSLLVLEWAEHPPVYQTQTLLGNSIKLFQLDDFLLGHFTFKQGLINPVVCFLQSPARLFFLLFDFPVHP